MAAIRRSSHRLDLLRSLRTLLMDTPGVRERPMFGYPAFFIGGRMFACLYGDGIGLKLPAARVSSLVEGVGARPFQPHGKARMREWIHVVPGPGEARATHRALVAEALAFVSTRPAPPPRPRR